MRVVLFYGTGTCDRHGHDIALVTDGMRAYADSGSTQLDVSKSAAPGCVFVNCEAPIQVAAGYEPVACDGGAWFDLCTSSSAGRWLAVEEVEPQQVMDFEHFAKPIE